ncbi:MAG TPA: 30S ribosomal protein S6 [Armatimonadota bacterium]|nr:30S ribosomal protein S6 [Armatimonadota bacterium]HOS42379.1 30S ribosomal protein S6 [Armatimonadota bacterium]
MRPYEVMYILQPTLSAEEQTALVDRFNDLITSMGGTVEKVDRWERRQLAYEIKRCRDGYYVVVEFQGDPALETEMDRQMKLTEPLLRHMIVRRDEH